MIRPPLPSRPPADRRRARRPRARRPRPGPRRLVAAVAGALAISLAAGACNTSPVAASVNGSEIKQTALDLELRLQTSNKAYVASVDRAAAAGNSTISVVGDAPGTYSTKFAAGVLSTMVQALAVHQHLAATGRLPGAEQLAAARGVDEALFGSTWLSFPEAFRDTQVAQDAEHAAVEPAPANPSQLQQAYQGLQQYLSSQVCVRSIAVAVRNAAGAIDEGASLSQATQIADQFNAIAADPTLGGVLGQPGGGTVTCYTGLGLEKQGAASFRQVTGLATGHASPPQRTASGYQVTAVESRQQLPLDTTVQKALALGIAQAQGASDPVLGTIVGRARVTVDPSYGTWDRATGSITVASPLGANSTTNP